MELRTIQNGSLPENSRSIHRNPRSIDSSPKETPTSSDSVIHENMEVTDMTKVTKSETKMVAFDAFRDKPFHEDQKYITFDGMKVNVGGAFNPDTGMVCKHTRC